MVERIKKIVETGYGLGLLSLSEAKKVASKIVTSLKNHTFIAHEHEIKLEATIGVAVMKNDRLFDLDSLIKDADHAMLKSKRRAGNIH